MEIWGDEGRSRGDIGRSERERLAIGAQRDGVGGRHPTWLGLGLGLVAHPNPNPNPDPDPHPNPNPNPHPHPNPNPDPKPNPDPNPDPDPNPKPAVCGDLGAAGCDGSPGR